METQINIKISAPEIAEAIKALATSINHFDPQTLKQEPQNPQKSQIPDPEQKYEQLQMDLSPIKLEDIHEKISKLAQQGRGVQIR